MYLRVTPNTTRHGSPITLLITLAGTASAPLTDAMCTTRMATVSFASYV